MEVLAVDKDDEHANKTTLDTEVPQRPCLKLVAAGDFLPGQACGG